MIFSEYDHIKPKRGVKKTRLHQRISSDIFRLGLVIVTTAQPNGPRVGAEDTGAKSI